MSAPTGSEAALAAASSGVTPDHIKARLELELGATYVHIDDQSGE
jgi:hypothetical protein